MANLQGKKLWNFGKLPSKKWTEQPLKFGAI